MFKRTFFNAKLLLTIAVCFQIIWVVAFVVFFSNAFFLADIILRFFSAFAVISIIKNLESPAVKLALVVPILLFPLFGGVFYFLHRLSLPTEAFNMHRLYKKANNLITPPLVLKDEKISSTLQYLKTQGFNAYPCYQTTYFHSGRSAFDDIIHALKRAKKYIFIEFYIIKEGMLFDRIFRILADKASQGVEVKIIYDDFGSLLLSRKKIKELNALNISTIAFNKMSWYFSAFKSVRNHKKTVVIDGETAYMGGINLGEEYINQDKDSPYWKDSAVKIEGMGATPSVFMFLGVWQALTRQTIDVKKYLPTRYKVTSSGVICPFAQNPSHDLVYKNVYISSIFSAEKSIVIFTPYLSPDEEVKQAILFAVKKGVKVDIVIPKIPDKKAVYTLSLLNAHELEKHSVNVWLYSGGFIHSKLLLVDEDTAIIGSANFDYRSLNYQFENGCILHKCDAIKSVIDDVRKTLEFAEKPPRKKGNVIFAIYHSLLKLFSPIF